MQRQSTGFQVIRAALRGGLWPYECSQLANYMRKRALSVTAERVLARLTESGLAPEVSTALLEEICARAGVAGLERQLDWLEQTGVLENAPGSPRRYAKDAPLHVYRALWGLVEAGYSHQLALTELRNCWQAVRQPEQFGLVLAHLAQGQQPRLLLELLGRFEPAVAVRLAETIARPVGRSSAAVRLHGLLAVVPAGAAEMVCLAVYRLYVRLLEEGVTSTDSLAALVQRLADASPEKAQAMLDTIATLPGSTDLCLARLAWAEDLEAAFRRVLRVRPRLPQTPPQTVFGQLRRWLGRAA